MPPVITHNHDMNGHILSPYMSLTHAKGLLNGPGQNNCFLNSAVQVLWHLDIFRRSFRELSGHACMMDSCIFCALKELFTQFQYSHESALPPDALRRALAETFVNQQRFQLGFMDDAAECFENILMRIHFHIANSESEDMCNAPHCIPHQKFAMTLVEQGVCHACGATSEPLPFTQMVHYISSSALCAQSKMNQEERSGGNFIEQFGQLLRKAGGLGEVRDCPSACGAKIQIQRTLMNRPEIVSIGIVWDSERPNLEHIMDVFQTIGTTVRLQDVFHSCVDDRWASTATHHLVGVVTYYGKHYSTFFFHTKLRVWIYFDDATVREIGPHWEQVVDKCRRGHFQPLLLLYANPYGDPVNTESAQKTVTYVPGHHCGDHQGRGYGPFDGIHGRGPIQQRRAVTPNPELHRDLCTDVQPRRAITPNAELHHGDGFIQRKPNYSSQMWYQLDSDPGYSSSDRAPSFPNGPQPSNSYTYYGPDPSLPYPGQAQPKAQGLYSGDLIQKLIGPSSKEGGYDQRGPLRTNGYFNNCDVPDGHHKGTFVYQQSGSHQNGTDNIYISRKAVESVLNYQKLQRHRHASGNYNGGSTAGNRNSNSSLESFENALRIRGQIGAVFPYEGKLPEVPDPAAPTVGNLPRSRDSGNWSGDRNSASSTSSASMENPYYILGSNKRQVPVQQGYRYSSGKGPAENGLRTPYDAGYDSFSLSSNDSFPVGQHGLPKHNQQLAQIPENVMDPAAKVVHNTGEFVDECQSLCMEADKFLEKSMERENTGDLDGAISLCNGAAAKARAAMDAPYSNPQILAFARMKHNSCIMRARSLHRRMLVRQDSINSHGSSSTSTEADSPRRPDGDAAGVAIHHSRQSSRDSVRSRREGTGNHSRQSSRDGGRHSRQGSRDATHTRQSSQDAAEKKRIELYGTLPKSGSKKKASLDKNRTGSMRAKDEMATMQRIESGFNMVQPTLHLAESDAYVHEAGLAKPLRPSETLFKREPSPLSTDYSEWESTRKPTLHRANSIPPNFQHDGTADGSQTYADASSKGGKDASRVGKKQHKIRRKLLMGGLIRRKNRSMPDLREGHDPSSAFDDSTLRQSEQSLDALGTHRRIPNALSLSHQNLYHETAHQRLYSSHGKIPPPPPVRTTSQLSTRSQSHGNLIYTPQSSAGHAASSLPAFALTSTERRTRSAALPEVAPPCPSVPTISGNKMTIQADVHHERTPSDNIRPVCLVRRPSANPHDALPKSVTALRIEPRTSSAPHPYSTPPPSVPVMARHHGTPAPIQPQASSDNGTENKDRDEEEPCPGGLLAELRMKRQQILNNAGTKPPQDPIPSEVKASGSTGSGWLRELQAKQQQMRNKKLDGPGGPTHYEGPTSTDTFSVLPSSHSQEDFKKQPPMKTTSVVSTNVRVPGVDTTSTSIAATNPTLPRAAVVGGPEYKPKSVRALANKFEQILLSPPVPSPNFPVPTSGPISKDMVDKQLESSKIVGNFSASQLNGVRSDEQLSSAIHGELYNGLSSPRLHSVKPAGNTDDIDGPLKGNCSSFPDVPIMKTATYNSKNVFESRPSTEQRGTSSSRCGPKSIAEDIGNLHSVNGINNGCNANANSVAYAMQTNRSQAPSSGAEWHCPPEVAGYDPRHPPNSQAVTHPHHGNFNVTRSGAYQNGTYADNLRMASHNSWPQNYYGASGNGGFGGNGIVPNGSVRLMDARTDGGFQRDLQQSSNGLPATGPSLNGVCDVGRYVAPPYDRVLPGYNPPPPVGPRAPNGARVNGVPGAASQRAPSLETNGMPQRSLSLETNGLPQWPDVDKMNQANATIGSEKGGLKKKKGKKSVTFSDQIALVASAEDSEVVPIPNPLLEKVLLKSAMASNMANKSGVNSSYTNPPRVNDHTGVQNRVESSVSPIHPLQSSPPLVPTTNHLNVNGAAPLPPYPNNPNVNKPKATGSKALCYLCGKKTVVPPVIYCLDCDFYMSRFRPKK